MMHVMFIMTILVNRAQNLNTVEYQHIRACTFLHWIQGSYVTVLVWQPSYMIYNTSEVPSYPIQSTHYTHAHTKGLSCEAQLLSLYIYSYNTTNHNTVQTVGMHTYKRMSWDQQTQWEKRCVHLIPKPAPIQSWSSSTLKLLLSPFSSWCTVQQVIHCDCIYITA